MSNIQELITGKGFIMVNKGLAKVVGLPAATIYGELVSSLLYWKDKGQLTEHKGLSWFYCTIEDLEDKTTLKRDAQDKAIKSLVKEGLIIVERFGLPAKRHFHITDKYIQILFSNYFAEKPQTDNINGLNDKNDEKQRSNQIAEKPQTGMRKNRKLDYGKSATNNKELNNKDLIKEEEEEVTTATVLSFINEQITKRQITDKKIITAIFEVADKCRAIGTTDRTAMENYCIKVIEEKMVKIGQKQKAAGKKPKDQATEIKPEGREERLEKMVSMRKTKGDVEEMTAEERGAYFKQAEELRKKLAGLDKKEE